MIAIALGYAAFRRELHKQRGLTSAAVAKIEKVEVQRTVDPVFGNERTAGILVFYSYDVDGAKYERQVRLSSAEGDAFVPWSTAKVCYDENDPSTISNGKLFPPKHTCGQ